MSHPSCSHTPRNHPHFTPTPAPTSRPSTLIPTPAPTSRPSTLTPTPAPTSRPSTLTRPPALTCPQVKYADLKNHRMTDYKFSLEAMLSMQGNTAVYLLYAHARIAGIGRKSGKDVAALATSATLLLDHPKEFDLALHIAKFPEAVEDTLTQLAPNRLTDFLYDLSEKFNAFYVECKVLGSEQEDSRLLLVEATAVAMRQCFSLLGITPMYKL
eukprot:357808-Chlamydomonas_euryale.AAC.10